MAGLTEQQARDRLLQSNLVLDSNILREASDQPADTVIRQTPVAEEEVEEGSTVQITLSAGPDNVEVPAGLVGIRLPRAQQEIIDAGLQVGNIT